MSLPPFSYLSPICPIFCLCSCKFPLFSNLVLLAYGLLIGGFFARTCIHPFTAVSLVLWGFMVSFIVTPFDVPSIHVQSSRVGPSRSAPCTNAGVGLAIYNNIYVYTPITNVLLWEEQQGFSITPESYQG